MARIKTGSTVTRRDRFMRIRWTNTGIVLKIRRGKAKVDWFRREYESGSVQTLSKQTWGKVTNLSLAFPDRHTA